MPRSPRRPSSDQLASLALGHLVGAYILADAKLAVVSASEEAANLVGTPLPAGVSIVKLLCGDGDKRPIADALAAGRSVSGTVQRPGPGNMLRAIDVRAFPLLSGKTREGWVLLVQESGTTVGASSPAVEFQGMLSRDPGMHRVFHIVERVASRDVSVLVRGPTGSGKELVAHAIHALSPRAAGPFRAVNCAALPPSLLESELFGHVKGSFTGATRDAPGIFRAAHRGTLFLDEVAEMPLELQAKLLRVLETRTVIPVGGSEPIEVDVRVVAATHQSLRAAVERGTFRADLMYRLRIVPIFLPALFARAGDVELLARRFIEQLNEQGGRRIERLTPPALAALLEYRWPGNVRELRSALEYAYVIGDGPELLETDLPPEISGAVGAVAMPSSAVRSGGEIEAQRISITLERTGGNRERAAQVLGISRVTLWRRMRALGLLSAEELRAVE